MDIRIEVAASGDVLCVVGWFWDTASDCTHVIDTRCFLVLCILGFLLVVSYLTMYSTYVFFLSSGLFLVHS